MDAQWWLVGAIANTGISALFALNCIAKRFGIGPAVPNGLTAIFFWCGWALLK